MEEEDQEHNGNERDWSKRKTMKTSCLLVASSNVSGISSSTTLFLQHTVQYAALMMICEDDQNPSNHCMPSLEAATMVVSPKGGEGGLHAYP